MKAARKERLDVLLVERGLCESREKAQRLIAAGKVRSGTLVLAKPGHRCEVTAPLVLEAAERYVSRGGGKLEHALAAFDCRVAGCVCLDVGASTGGFTDCLLQHGAARVYAVDVGRGQLHWRLRRDPRVVVREDVNARRLLASDFPERMDFAAIDVSFISLTLILPAVMHVVKDGARIVTLIKPQFEAGRDRVGRGGVVRDPAVRDEVVERIRRFGGERLGLRWVGVSPSPVRGPAGNVEFLACWETP